MGAIWNPHIVPILLFFAFFANISFGHDDPPVNEFHCTKTGFFPHPSDKQKFYECVSYPPNPSTLMSYTYTCPAHECFDNDNVMKCSVEGCSKNANSSDEFSCLKAHLKKDAQLICKEETLNKLSRLFVRMVEFTAVRGTPFENLKLTLRDANLRMRENYGRMIENVGKNVFPLMVLTDGEPDYFGVGGVIKIYLKNGDMKRIIPVNPAFEMHKSLSHIVLGVFSIVSPYFRNPNSITWQPALRNFQQNNRDILHLLSVGESNISAEEKATATFILRRTITYIDNAIRKNSVEMSEFHSYATELAPYIEKSMGWAATAHAQDTIPALQKLKEDMGETEWRNMFVIIPTVWPVSLFNIRLQALEKVMSFDQIKSQVLIVEGARTEADAKTTLGRVVADRAIAQLVWGGLDQATMRDHVFSLSTRRDLLSSTTNVALEQVCQSLEAQNKPKCPFAGRSNRDGSGIQNVEDHYRMPATMLRS